MKISTNLSLTCALLGAVATLGAPQIVCAQQQPRRAQSAINVDAKIVFFTQFDASQFFDALAKATKARIVAPAPDAKQLAKLNQSLGGKTLTLEEIAPLYQSAVGYDLANVAGDLIKVRLPDALLYPTPTLDENYAAFLRLADALSPAQIEQMNLQSGLTVQDLTPAQSALYLEARRKNANVAYVLGDNKPMTDEQILAQPVRFRFAFQAKALFTDDEALPSLALFDYGTGLIWNPLVGADTKKFEKFFNQGTMVEGTATPGKPIVADMAKAMNTPLNFEQRQTTTFNQLLYKIGKATGQPVAIGAELKSKKLSATPILITAGNYKTGELTDAVAASVGLQFGFLNGVPTLTKRRAEQPISQLPPLVEAAEQKLRRLPLENSGLPFSADRFERKSIGYEYLSGAEIFYLRAKLLNENTEGYDKIDLSKHTFRFANQLLFIGQTGDRNTPFVTSSLQLW